MKMKVEKQNMRKMRKLMEPMLNGLNLVKAGNTCSISSAFEDDKKI